MKWQYGITTVPERRRTTLPTTLRSLEKAGFTQPRLFMDGYQTSTLYQELSLPYSIRDPILRPMGNWWLALWELYIREPEADRYVIFQDDLLACTNLRQYLEKATYPERGYLNLYTAPSNESMIEFGKQGFGWVRARTLTSGPSEPVPYQTGRGALGLVFDKVAARTLLCSPHFVQKFTDPHRGWRSIDGAVVTAMNQAGFSEYVHCPSLLQHIGDKSTIGNLPLADRHQSQTFPGDDFDALTLLG